MNFNNRRRLLKFLTELDKRIARLRPRVRTPIYIFGGAAVVLGYNAPRATMDLDVWIDDREIERNLLEWAGRGSLLEARYQIYLQWAPVVFMPIEEPQWRRRSRKVLRRLRHFDVRVLGVADLILSKLGRYDDRDRADIEFLIRKFKPRPATLIRYYRSARRYYAGDLRTLDQIFNLLLGEHFDKAPLRFAA